MLDEPVSVVGGGLAGCEAAWQLARRGIRVRLLEMKPLRLSPAHSSPSLAELVCSNSLRSDQIHNAVGLLHEEMRRLDSLVLRAADAHRVPAGKALAVDRERFASAVTEQIDAEPRIEREAVEVTEIPSGTVILATGPLTSGALAGAIGELCGDALYFYDSISPIVYRDSVDVDVAFRASRYEEGEGDYLNLSLSRTEYYAFIDALVKAETVPLHRSEQALYFEGCLPIEVMAERGAETLRFGPLKPVGLADPATGETAFAVLQLRNEDEAGTLLNLVGCQTRMRIGEQKRSFRALPGLRDAVFARFGSMHRNTFIRTPVLLTERMEHRARPGLFFAGQIAGVEGYVESAALGLFVGVEVARRSLGHETPLPPATTALGSLLRYLSGARPGSFQPMNVNYGLFPPLAGGGRRVPKRERNERQSARALADLAPWAERVRPA